MRIRIQQVFLHLLRICEEAMPDGGEIVIEAENFCAASDLPPGLKKDVCALFRPGSRKGHRAGIPVQDLRALLHSKPKWAEKGSGSVGHLFTLHQETWWNHYILFRIRQGTMSVFICRPSRKTAPPSRLADLLFRR